FTFRAWQQQPDPALQKHPLSIRLSLFAFVVRTGCDAQLDTQLGKVFVRVLVIIRSPDVQPVSRKRANVHGLISLQPVEHQIIEAIAASALECLDVGAVNAVYTHADLKILNRLFLKASETASVIYLLCAEIHLYL